MPRVVDGGVVVLTGVQRGEERLFFERQARCALQARRCHTKLKMAHGRHAVRNRSAPRQATAGDRRAGGYAAERFSGGDRRIMQENAV